MTTSTGDGSVGVLVDVGAVWVRFRKDQSGSMIFPEEHIGGVIFQNTLDVEKEFLYVLGCISVLRFHSVKNLLVREGSGNIVRAAPEDERGLRASHRSKTTCNMHVLGFLNAVKLVDQAVLKRYV